MINANAVIVLHEKMAAYCIRVSPQYLVLPLYDPTHIRTLGNMHIIGFRTVVQICCGGGGGG